MTTLVAGVDGCRAGWLCVLATVGSATPVEVFILPTIDALIARTDIAMIAIDIPIGLPAIAEPGGRLCDRMLRSKLGERQSAVFAVPARAAVAETDYACANAVALAHSQPARKVSRQCFHLFPKIREVDARMTPALQARLVECHPEGAFWALNGRRPLSKPKKVKSQPYQPGLALRRALLAQSGLEPSVFSRHRFPAASAREDDLLDACACCWTAGRVLKGEAIRFPELQPPVDETGLRMEIFA